MFNTKLSHGIKSNCLLGICLSFLLLNISGCSSTSYPKNWAPLQTTSQSACPDLTGSYHAESIPPAYAKSCESKNFPVCKDALTELADYKKPRWKLRSKMSDHWIKLQGPKDNILRLTMFDKDGEVGQHILNAATGDFYCEQGDMVIKVPAEAMADSTGIGMNTGRRRAFRLATDGALVMRDSAGVAGLAFLFIPVVDYFVSWWKWLPKETEPPGDP